MPWVIVRHEHRYHPSIEAREEVLRRLDALLDQTGLILDRQEKIMIDTSKLLASAAKQSTENASLRALLVSVKDQLTKSTAELAAAIAASDPAAIAAAQKDIDDTVALLDADDADTAAALGENVQPTP